jgi:hypothetical protein
MSIMTRFFAFFLLLCALVACGPAPTVVQGKVVRYDPAAKVLVVADELTPARAVELSLQDAEVGAEPTTGDTVRIAYWTRQGRHVASRVMNISRQDEMGKKGAKSSGAH